MRWNSTYFYQILRVTLKNAPGHFFSDINQNNVTPAYIFLLHWCQGSLIFTWRVPQYRLPTNKKIDNLNDFWVEFKSENSPTNRRTKTHFISSKNSVPFVFESACSTKQSCRFCKILWKHVILFWTHWDMKLIWVPDSIRASSHEAGWGISIN